MLEGDALVEKRGGTLGDTLDGLPGVHSDTFGGGASRPVIRGQTAPRVKALSDGSELMDASAISPDHAVTTEPLLAERIEVLRGPAALLWRRRHRRVVNVIDKKIPTEVPEKGIAAEAEIRGATGTKERAGAIGITAGEGNFAVRVEGMKRRSGDYRVPDWSSSKLDGSYSESTQGTVGMSWITPRGYIGLAFTHLESKYGLPGHNHEYEGCHPHGTHLHCGGHDHGDEDGHDHDHGAEGGGLPYVKLRSNRTDLRAEYLDPFAGIEKIRLRGGLTDYQHQEIEGGEVGTTFKNRGYDLRLEAQQSPSPAGAAWWACRRPTAISARTARKPSCRAARRAPTASSCWRNTSWPTGASSWARARLADGFAPGRRAAQQPVGHLAVGGSHLELRAGVFGGIVAVALAAPADRAGALRQGRAPATNTYEIGNAGLGRETSHNIDLTLRKHSGATTFSASVFHNRVKNYIYANTLDRYEDFRLIEYTSATPSSPAWKASCGISSRPCSRPPSSATTCAAS